MNKKLHIKVGDTVMVMAGTDKGQQGRVLSIDKKKERATVEGLNMISKHTKPNAAHPDGGIVKEEAGIHISNLMMIDPKSKKPSRIGRKEGKDGKLVRYYKKSGDLV